MGLPVQKCIIIFIFLFSLTCFGQKEPANWYFGNYAGLSFVSGVPVPLLDGQLNTLEGSASISTPEGDLLFYTDGVKVYNRNHTLMPNGIDLLGSTSSTQSCIIIPKPNSGSIFYIFTTDEVSNYSNDGNGNGINYSIVDMNANGGLGDVITKNQNLLAQGSEKITGVFANDGESFWIITHLNDSFYSFLLTASGVDETPVVSTIGPNISDINNIRGSLKVSPDGSKLAIAHSIFQPAYGGKFLLYDFNNTTGQISNQRILADDNLVYYGIEFSSNSSKLYVSGKLIPEDNTNDLQLVEVNQFDLEAPNIAATRQTIGSAPIFASLLSGTLQLAIDKKIYFSISNGALSVINSPNNLGIDCDMRNFSVPLGGETAHFGLPQFVPSFFESIVKIENFCYQNATQFTLDTNRTVTSIQWNFGDPNSSTNTTTDLNPSHVFTAPGLYTVTMNVSFANIPDRTFIEYVEIRDIPEINNGITLTQCDVDTENDGRTIFNLSDVIPLLVNNNTNVTATFFETRGDAEANENQLPVTGYENLQNNQTVYVRVFENSTCYAIGEIMLRVEPLGSADTITVEVCNTNVNPLFITINLGDIETILLQTYPNTQITFYLTEEDALLERSPLLGTYDANAEENISLFYRIENDNECVGVGEVLVETIIAPSIEDQEVFICPEETAVTLSLPDTYEDYLWSTGENTPTISATAPGTYTVTLSTGSGCEGTATFIVEQLETPEIIDVEIKDFTDNNTIKVVINNPDFYQYALAPGSTRQDDPVFYNVPVGIYTVQVWKNQCLLYETVVMVGGAAQFFTPNGDGFNDVWEINGIEAYPNASVLIFDRFGKALTELRYPSEGWDGIYRGTPMPSSDYWYRIQLDDGRTVRGHFTLKR